MSSRSFPEGGAHLQNPLPVELLEPKDISAAIAYLVSEGEAAFREINCLPFAPARDNPYSGAGILNFVFGEMWLRPGLGMKERRLITVACVGFQDAQYPIVSHAYAALKSGDVSFDEMDELALHFAAHYGWLKASHLNQVIAEQKRRVLDEAGSDRPI